MSSIYLNSAQVVTDQISSASRVMPLTSLVKKALAIITINGLLTSKMKAAASGTTKAALCALQCALLLPNPSEYLGCFTRCMAGS